MLQAIARLAIRAPRQIILVAALVALAPSLGPIRLTGAIALPLGVLWCFAVVPVGVTQPRTAGPHTMPSTISNTTSGIRTSRPAAAARITASAAPEVAWVPLTEVRSPADHHGY